jgi:hypothetical protein
MSEPKKDFHTGVLFFAVYRSDQPQTICAEGAMMFTAVK